MYDVLHLHDFSTNTSKTYDHEHIFKGITSKNPNFKGHTHYMSGYTEDKEGHIHYFSLITGPGFKVKEGHIHFYKALSTIDQKDYHFIMGYTSVYSDY